MAQAPETKVARNGTNEASFFGPAGILLIYALLGTTMEDFLFRRLKNSPLDA